MRKKAWKLRNALIEKFANWGNRFLYKLHVAWWADRSWLSPYEKYLEADRHPGQPKTRILDRRFTLLQFVKAVRQLPGCTAECGVFSGVASALICKALEGTYQDGEHHFGFDSFEGLPEPTKLDRLTSSSHLWSKGAHWWSKGALCRDFDNTKAYLSDFPYCKLVKGWIPACFELAKEHRFRFVHIDVDLHQATWDSLEFFYPRIASGGIFLFDDFGFLSCPGARSATVDFFSDKTEPIIELATGQAVVIKA